jgi:hypothetical protein
LQEDMRVRWTDSLANKRQADSLLAQCKSGSSLQQQRADLLQRNVAAQQQTIDSQQSQLNAAQGTMNSCVVSLGKMNPVVSTKIKALPLQVFNQNGKDKFGLPIVTYAYAIVIMTNRNMEPVGDLKCANAFSPGTPQLTAQAQMAMVGTGAPTPISDREYEIRVSNTGASWTDENPSYMGALSQQ